MTFYKEFEIEKVEYRTPGRDWDDDGLASWYVEYDYPAISGDVFFALLDLYSYWSSDKFSCFCTQSELVETLKEQLLKLLHSLGEEQAKSLKSAVQDIIASYGVED